MVIESIARRFLFEGIHEAVPGHFGHDGGGRDARAAGIAVDDGELRMARGPEGKAVYQEVLGLYGKGRHSAPEGQLPCR
jgi:hypothetical protein